MIYHQLYGGFPVNTLITPRLRRRPLFPPVPLPYAPYLPKTLNVLSQQFLYGNRSENPIGYVPGCSYQHVFTLQPKTTKRLMYPYSQIH